MIGNKALWQGSELTRLFAIPGVPDVTGISIDSRTVSPGDLFIALSGDPGPRFGGGEASARDGHDFIAGAVAAGAACLMVHRDGEWTAPQLRVGDTLDGLWQLGAAGRERTHGKIIAVTGSAGKTTVRGWLETLLAPIGSTHGSVGSFNNHWGVPLSLARMPAESEFGIFEIGTNHAGEIGPLSLLAKPDVAVLLNVLPAHIGNFADMAALEAEKLAIGSGLTAGGTLVLPRRFSDQLENAVAAQLTFGTETDADIRLLEIAQSHQPEGAEVRVSILGEQHQLQLPFADEPRIVSVLAALGVMVALELDLERVRQQLQHLSLPVGRGDEHECGRVLVIDDSYNANPGSMSLALTNLKRRQTEGRKIAVLGEMLELGEHGEAAHRAVGLEVAGLDVVYTFGAGFAGAGSADAHYDDISGFDVSAFADSLVAGDIVLIKGSNKVFWQHNFVHKLLEVLAKRAPNEFG
ncbi:MAG: UDP-N-acetylmuramoyl-tripeptide--D-alanyl-D-alanine ligase [Gammaproteobacteria bacterium]